MALHLLKLCVGPATIEDLEQRIAHYRDEAVLAGREPSTTHVTRMVPKRASAIAGQGSIYWVIKGTLCCRQAITAIEPFTDSDGIGRCRLVLDPVVVPVNPRPCRPFQGWRYLTARSAPADLAMGRSDDLADMPESLRRELSVLGLI
ncbi:MULTISPECIES: DUF1489 domain-containing protein [Methylobacterium]|uniref:Lysophospholipase n=1 Tax=Methylobacterium bullatum TaxID=570505 RepID=A0AAV4ZBT0_9HYPH|nr:MULTISPECIES: DUF1489 domain-containing protein [Methylobacterium]MBD8900979.1 lysophospholipase [Methylobacterium bullatum]TXN25912.1 DUF1489 family protein [Methylobacterium sp. WL19]GJD41523.1 hypothetical protein OICFNHDK_4006 [Methylobacterium bullatum]